MRNNFTLCNICHWELEDLIQGSEEVLYNIGNTLYNIFKLC